MRRLETFTPFTFIPSSRFCKLRPRLIILLKTHFILLVKFPISSLAPAFLYCKRHLSLYNWYPPRSNLSYRHETHRTCSSWSSRQRNNRMDLCLWRNGNRSSFTSDWLNGFEVGDWDFTTFVRISIPPPPSFRDTDISFVDFWWWWLLWVPFGPLYLRNPYKQIHISIQSRLFFEKRLILSVMEPLFMKRDGPVVQPRVAPLPIQISPISTAAAVPWFSTAL